VVTGVPFCFNGNVPNDGLITNLVDGCCVEVPCYADRHGVNPAFVGDLPPQLAAINQAHVAVSELTVQAALTGDRDAVYQACALDPLTGAVCSLDEVHAMCDELFEASAAWLPMFKKRQKATKASRRNK
jgi:alpha-galactosidase